MGTDITVTTTEVNQCLRGILMHLQSTGIAKDFDSFSDAMEKLDLWDFVFNQAAVSAYLHADNRRLNYIVHRGS